MARRYTVPRNPVVRLDCEGEYLIAPHWPYYGPERLGAVRAELERRGCLLIRAMWDGTGWRGIEGSHRTYLAHLTDTLVDIQPVEPDYRLHHDEPEFGIVTAGWLLDSCQVRKRGQEARYEAKR